MAAEVLGPVSVKELRVKNRFHRRNFEALFQQFFASSSPRGSQSLEQAQGYWSKQPKEAVIIVSHSGTISNMLFSHLDKAEQEVLKPRNASVIAIDAGGGLDLQHEGTLPPCKADEDHEYFTQPQFDSFAAGSRFGFQPPASCLLLLVRHGIAINNVNKAYTDGGLTSEGEASVIKAALRISHVLRQHDIARVRIFTSMCIRTRHSSALLYDVLGRPPLATSRSLPCLTLSRAHRGDQHPHHHRPHRHPNHPNQRNHMLHAKQHHQLHGKQPEQLQRHQHEQHLEEHLVPHSTLSLKPHCDPEHQLPAQLPLQLQQQRLQGQQLQALALLDSAAWMRASVLKDTLVTQAA